MALHGQMANVHLEEDGSEQSATTSRTPERPGGISMFDASKNATLRGNSIGAYHASAGGTQIFYNWHTAPQHTYTPNPPTSLRQTSAPTNETSLEGSRNRAQVYYDHLFTEGRGSPLWIPGPNRRLPLAYRQRGISVGDVGILNPDGGFSYLFNIFAPANDPINIGRVPPSFEHLPPPGDMDLEEYDCYGPWSVITSSSVHRSSDNNSSNLQFESSSGEGAMLTMPQGALCFTLRNKERLNHYLQRQAGSWYDFLLRKGWDLENGDIRLVFGCDKVSSWGIATFLSQRAVAGRVVFRAPSSPGHPNQAALSYDCRGSADAKTGPQEDDVVEIKESESRPTDTDSPHLRNQCVFIRTLNPRLSKKAWGALIEPIWEQSGPGFWSYGSSASTSRSANGKNPEPSRFGAASIPTVSTTSLIEHPSSTLNPLLLERFPTADMVITSDDQWTSVLRKDEPLPSSEVLLERMEQKFTYREENGVVTPSRNVNIVEPRNGLPNRLSMSFPGADVCIVCHRRSPSTMNGQRQPTCDSNCAATLYALANNLIPSSNGDSRRVRSSGFATLGLLGGQAVSKMNIASPISPKAQQALTNPCVICRKRDCCDMHITCGLLCAEMLMKGAADAALCDYCHRRPKPAGLNHCSQICQESARLACMLCRSRPILKGSYLCSKLCKGLLIKHEPLMLEAPEGHAAWKMVYKEFNSAWKFGSKPTIKKIYRIVASAISAYDEYKNRVGNEVFLFHGTSRRCILGWNANATPCKDLRCSLCGIIRTNFRTSLANLHAAFGPGIYTSSASNKAYTYSKGTLLLTKVALGRSYNVTAFGAVSSCPTGYDSVVFDRNGGTLNETVVYSDDAIRPLFLIIFT